MEDRTQRSGRIDRRGVVAGALIALAVPLVSLGVAYAWGHGFVTLEPNGPFVQAIEGTAMWEIVLGPVGLVVAGRAARLNGVLPWLALFIIGLPVVGVLWFIGVAYLGGLAGEPF